MAGVKTEGRQTDRQTKTDRSREARREKQMKDKIANTRLEPVS